MSGKRIRGANGRFKNKDKISLKCEQCSVVFEVCPSFAKRGARFCSRKCCDESKIGQFISQETRIKRSLSTIGSKSHRWKGGVFKRDDGYIEVHFIGHPKRKGRRVLQHRLIVEKYLGRTLNKDEVVHHINGKKDDNRIENLRVMTNSEHSKLHHKLCQKKC